MWEDLSSQPVPWTPDTCGYGIGGIQIPNLLTRQGESFSVSQLKSWHAQSFYLDGCLSRLNAKRDPGNPRTFYEWWMHDWFVTPMWRSLRNGAFMILPLHRTCSRRSGTGCHAGWRCDLGCILFFCFIQQYTHTHTHTCTFDPRCTVNMILCVCARMFLNLYPSLRQRPLCFSGQCWSWGFGLIPVVCKSQGTRVNQGSGFSAWTTRANVDFLSASFVFNS